MIVAVNFVCADSAFRVICTEKVACASSGGRSTLASTTGGTGFSSNAPDEKSISKERQHGFLTPGKSGVQRSFSTLSSAEQRWPKSKRPHSNSYDVPPSGETFLARRNGARSASIFMRSARSEPSAQRAKRAESEASAARRRVAESGRSSGL